MKCFYFMLPIFFLACSSEKQVDTAETQEDTASDSSAVPDEVFLPAFGNWMYSELAYTEDNCTFNAAPNNRYSISTVGSIVYDLVEIAEEYVVFFESITYSTIVCSRDGNVITCTQSDAITWYAYDENNNIIYDENDNPVFIDATSTLHADFVVTLSSVELGSLNATITMSCDGQDCDEFNSELGITNPCSSTITGIMSLQ